MLSPRVSRVILPLCTVWIKFGLIWSILPVCLFAFRASLLAAASGDNFPEPLFLTNGTISDTSRNSDTGKCSMISPSEMSIFTFSNFPNARYRFLLSTPINFFPKTPIEYFPPISKFSFIPFSPHLCWHFQFFCDLSNCMSHLLCSQHCNDAVFCQGQQMPWQNRQGSHPIHWTTCLMYIWWNASRTGRIQTGRTGSIIPL